LFFNPVANIVNSKSLTIKLLQDGTK